MNRSPIAGLRVRFYSFLALAVAGVAVDAPVPSVAAAVFICAATLLAVALQEAGGVGALFLPSRFAHVAAPVGRAAPNAHARRR
jgi:hypothetical protein